MQVYGCNHVAIEVDDIDKAVAFYQDVFNLEKLDRGEGDAFFKLGEHQFLAIFEVETIQPANVRHFGIMVRDEEQLEEVRRKLTGKYKLKLEPPFRCDFRDPWGNRIQVVDLRENFYAHRGWFFSVGCGAVVVSIAKEFVLAHRLPNTTNLVFN